MVKSGEFVFPGMEIGFTEEFIPGEGTYEEEGKIYASLIGSLAVDTKERRISVAPKTSTIPVIKTGDIVIGSIVDVKQQFAIVDIIKIKDIDRALPGSISGTIHISKVRDAYVSDLSRELSPGDIVRAKVANIERGISIQLSTAGKDLGVLKAFCYSCNTGLIKTDNKLKCENCGRIEGRKFASNYGKGEL